MKEITEITVPANHEAVTTGKKVEKKSGRRIGFNYIILKSLKESQKNDVIKCIYIKSLTNFGLCVVKEGSFGDTKDKEGRDIRDRLIWQLKVHHELQGKLKLPRILDSFEEQNNFYLVMQYISGKSLYNELKTHYKTLKDSLISGGETASKFLDYLVQITWLLQTLHENNYVHRDVTPANFIITSDGVVYIIDMELSYSLNNALSSPFRLGTIGYMSPEQHAVKDPTIKEDIFSLGAIIFQCFSGIHPLKIIDTDPQHLADKICFLIPDLKISRLVVQCLQSDPGERPDTKTINQILDEYRRDLINQIDRPKVQDRTFYKREEIISTIQQAMQTMSTPLMADEQRGWFSEDLHKPSPDKTFINKAWYASFSQGASGIMYLLSKARQVNFDIHLTMPFFNKGVQIIQEKYISRIDTANPGLTKGTSGIAIALASSIQQGILAANPTYIDWLNQLLEKENADTDLLNGIAGQGIANLYCRSFIPTGIIQERAFRYIDQLVNNQEPDGSWIRKSNSKKGRKTRGLSKGAAGIIWFLLETGRTYQHQPALESAERGLHWLIKSAVRQEDTIQWTSTSGKELTYGLLEGTAGIALTFLKAFEVTGAPDYLTVAEGALRGISANLVDSNLSHANGLSGLGEVYLEAYRVLSEEVWLERARWIVQVILHLKKLHPEHGVYWLVENEKQPLGDFMTGNSGVIHFLMRYAHHNALSFPLLS